MSGVAAVQASFTTKAKNSKENRALLDSLRRMSADEYLKYMNLTSDNKHLNTGELFNKYSSDQANGNKK
jgi:hypothetical protein